MDEFCQESTIPEEYFIIEACQACSFCYLSCAKLEISDDREAKEVILQKFMLLMVSESAVLALEVEDDGCQAGSRIISLNVPHISAVSGSRLVYVCEDALLNNGDHHCKPRCKT